jgi:hypothetical protein
MLTIRCAIQIDLSIKKGFIKYTETEKRTNLSVKREVEQEIKVKYHLIHKTIKQIF